MGEEKYLCSLVEKKYLSMNEPEEIAIHLFDMYIKEFELLNQICVPNLLPWTHEKHIIVKSTVATCSAAAGATTGGRLSLTAAAVVFTAREHMTKLPFRMLYLDPTTSLPSLACLRDLHLFGGLWRHRCLWALQQKGDLPVQIFHSFVRENTMRRFYDIAPIVTNTQVWQTSLKIGWKKAVI